MNTPWTPENTPKRLEVIITMLFDGNARALARKLGVHHVTMSRWMNGHRAPQKLCWRALEELETAALKNYHLKQRREAKT